MISSLAELLPDRKTLNLMVSKKKHTRADRLLMGKSEQWQAPRSYAWLSAHVERLPAEYIQAPAKTQNTS